MSIKLRPVFLMGLWLLAACAVPAPVSTPTSAPTQEAAGIDLQFIEFYSPF